MIYLDNASTSWPKPPQVGEKMQEIMTSHGGNPGRGRHTASLENAHLVYRVREKIAAFFKLSDPLRIIFTLNATHAINQALFGLLKPGDHVITTSIEHNAVSRPLHALSKQGIELTILPIGFDQPFPFQLYKEAFRENTRLVVTLHASNVTGMVLPIQKIGAIAHEYRVPYLVDASQTAGILPIDLNTLPIDILALPGHKGLLGPTGTGVLILPGLLKLSPLIYGGTGSLSESLEQPDFLPDALESGTLNTVGIAGLGAAIDYLNEVGAEHIYEQERQLCTYLAEGLKTIDGLILYSQWKNQDHAPIVSFNLEGQDSTLVSHTLEQISGIIARAGLHCAPNAHSSLGTIEQGTVRFSPSHFTTKEEIEKTVETVSLIAKEML